MVTHYRKYVSYSALFQVIEKDLRQKCKEDN